MGKNIFRAIKETVINFLGNIRIYPGGFVLFGESKYKLKGPDWREIIDLIQPGDILGSSHQHYVSSFFIKGDFSHVGLYAGDNQVIHVRPGGIIKEDILTFLRADDAFVVRPKDQNIAKEAVKKAYEQLAAGVAYDFDFDRQNTDEFYCSEFTDFCTGYILKNGVSKDKSYTYPDDYLIPSEHFDIMWRKK